MGSSGSSGLSSGLEMPNVSKSRTQTSQTFNDIRRRLRSFKIQEKRNGTSKTMILQSASKIQEIKSYDILEGSKVPGDFPKSRCMCRNLKFRLGKKEKKMKRNMQVVLDQIDLLASLNHPNLLEFIGVTLSRYL